MTGTYSFKKLLHLQSLETPIASEFKRILQKFLFKSLYFTNFLSFFLYYIVTLLDAGILYWQALYKPAEVVPETAHLSRQKY